ncbi:Hpt domain-containing protein [Azospira sp. I13]|uniref:Hpt domain-containing protein n=1 Tax=Azospira sp. I13 TaxID=1765050 RepID=UPI000D58DD52|nr:Hpt domain-containing protein [Azospira sp. I13]
MRQALQTSCSNPLMLLEQLNGDRDAARDLAQAFLDNFPVMLQQLDEALAEGPGEAAASAGEEGPAGQAEALRNVVHQLKGVCAIFAADAVVARAREIEALLVAGQLAAGVAEIGPWRAELDELAGDISRFSQYLAGLEP